MSVYQDHRSFLCAFIDAYTNGKITKNKEGHIYFLSVSAKMCLKTMHIQGYDFFKGDRGI